MKHASKSLTALALCASAAGFYKVWQDNTHMEITRYVIQSARIPASFSGARILQVSDFHHFHPAVRNHALQQLAAPLHPDKIVITGDLIDRAEPWDEAKALVEDLKSIAPVIYVLGNHESAVPGLSRFLSAITDESVTLLRNSFITWEKGADTIILEGVDDPCFHISKRRDSRASAHYMKETLQSLDKKHPGLADPYTILLSHRPELFSIYAESRRDLVLTGHAHGGQYRLPLIGALYAPDQGLFPRYTSGIFKQDRTIMEVCRGLGTSHIPFRLLDPPEVVLLELQHVD